MVASWQGPEFRSKPEMTTRRTPSTEGEVVPLSLTDGRLSFCQFTLGESHRVRNNPESGG